MPVGFSLFDQTFIDSIFNMVSRILVVQNGTHVQLEGRLASPEPRSRICVTQQCQKCFMPPGVTSILFFSLFFSFVFFSPFFPFAGCVYSGCHAFELLIECNVQTPYEHLMLHPLLFKHASCLSVLSYCFFSVLEFVLSDLLLFPRRCLRLLFPLSNAVTKRVCSYLTHTLEPEIQEMKAFIVSFIMRRYIS